MTEPVEEERIQEGDHVLIREHPSKKWRGKYGQVRHTAYKLGFALVVPPELDPFDVRCPLDGLDVVPQAEAESYLIPLASDPLPMKKTRKRKTP